LRYGGTISLLGVLTGVRGEVNTYGIFHKGLRIAGIYVGEVAMFEGLVRGEDQLPRTAAVAHPDLTSAVVSLNLAVLDCVAVMRQRAILLSNVARVGAISRKKTMKSLYTWCARFVSRRHSGHPMLRKLMVTAGVLGIFLIIHPATSFAQFAECANPDAFPRAIMYRDLGNNQLALPPLYRGQGAAGSFTVPNLNPGFTEGNIQYFVLAQTFFTGYTMPLRGSGSTIVYFTFPGSVPLDTYRFRIERRSDVFDIVGRFAGGRRIVYCSLDTPVVDPPVPDGPLSNTSAASFTAPVAPDSIVAAFGSNLAVESQSASLPLPTTLAGTTVRVTDSAGTTRTPVLFFVSPSQVNYLMPPGTTPGQATVGVTAGNGRRSSGTVRVEGVAPGLFTQNNDGKGVPSGTALRIKADGSQVYESISRFDATTNRFVPAEIDISTGEMVYLVLYGTGLRQARTVNLKIGGVDVAAQFFGPQPNFVGTDQINVLLPTSLIGRKLVDLQLFADGKASNVVQISIQ